MATKKKAVTAKKKQTRKHPKKMEPALVSSQPWEVLRVRLIHYIAGKGDTIVHPERKFILQLIKKHNNSRNLIYLSLSNAGYSRIKKRGA